MVICCESRLHLIFGYDRMVTNSFDDAEHVRINIVCICFHFMRCKHYMTLNHRADHYTNDQWVPWHVHIQLTLYIASDKHTHTHTERHTHTHMHILASVVISKYILRYCQSREWSKMLFNLFEEKWEMSACEILKRRVWEEEI